MQPPVLDDFDQKLRDNAVNLRREAWQRWLTWFVSALLLALAGQTVSRALWFHPQKFTTIWIPGGVLLALLLLRPKRDWSALTVGTIIGGALALMPLGAPYQNAYIGYAIICTAIVIAAQALHGSSPMAFASIRSFARYLFITVVALSAFSGWVTAVIVTGAGMTTNAFQTWLSVWPAQAMGFLLLTPPVLAVASAWQWPSRLSTVSILEASLLLVGLATISYGLWAAVSPTPALLPLLLFAPIPLLLIAALRYGVLGSSLGLLLVAMPAAGLGVYRNGPFNMNGEQADVHMLQLWMLAVALLIHPLAIQSRQRRFMHERLSANHRRIRKLATGLLQGQEAERTRLSRELHDGVNQRLALLAIKLSAMKDADHARVAHRNAELRALVEDISDDVRRISHNLHPAVLDHAGLFGSLRSLVEEVSQSSPAHIQFSCTCPGERPAGAVSLCLYRIAQEGLLNAVKHSDAKEITLRLERAQHHFVMQVIDDGRGFDLTSTARLGGLGLLSMQERAGLINGTVEIRSRLGRGTELTARIPVAAEAPMVYSTAST